MSVNILDHIGSATGDVTDQVNAAVAAARATGTDLYLPAESTIRIDGHANLRYVRRLDLAGIIQVGPQGLVTIGNSRLQRSDSDLRIRRIEWADRSQTNIVLRTVGLKSAILHVGYCDYWQWYADPTESVDQSSSYCTTTVGRINRFQLYCRKKADGSDFGWITELLFIGGDWRHIEFDTDYIINQITWIKPCVEGGEIHIPRGHRIQFIDARGEGGTKLYLGPDSSRVIFEDGFAGDPLAMSAGAVMMQDDGIDNAIIPTYSRHLYRHTLATVGQDSPRGGVLPVPGPDARVVAPSTFTTLVDTGLVDVRGAGAGSTLTPVSSWRINRIAVTCDTSAVRVTVTAYDANRAPIPDETALTVDGSLTWKGTHWGHNSNTPGASVVVASPAVRYVQVVVLSGSPTRAFGWLRVDAYTLGQSSTQGVDRARQQVAALTPAHTASAMPTEGQESGGRVCVSRVDTTTDNPADAGDTSIAVTSIHKIAVGDDIGITIGESVHWTTVAAISSRVVSLSRPLPAAASQGSAVTAVRWR